MYLTIRLQALNLEMLLDFSRNTFFQKTYKPVRTGGFSKHESPSLLRTAKLFDS